jgi:hypothetical protein
MEFRAMITQTRLERPALVPLTDGRLRSPLQRLNGHRAPAEPGIWLGHVVLDSKVIYH